MQPLTVPAYNTTINVSPPLLEDFDVRSFEDNMDRVPMRIQPFRIGFYQIAILESGGGRVNSDGSDYDLRNCTLFFNLTSQIVYWDIQPDWRGYYCCLPETCYTSPLTGYPTLADFPFFRHPHPGIHLRSHEALHVVETLRRMHDKHQETDNPHHRLRTMAEVNVLLTDCLQAYARYVDEAAVASNASRLSDRFVELIRQNVSELALGLTRVQLRAGTAAAALFVTPGHLAERTRQDLGQTPSAYIQGQLIAQACKLLTIGEQGIGEIADQLGFNSMAYFGRVFAKLTGKSPTGYRDGCG
ncbi:helix-turn-helix domain-containing protein [Neolewinella sp.]|uniref:helix-turn-helix domain-containing protein n=1 Tax=Neolewinella sp. TaxID=2993543 RepID=UPI003B516BBA